MFTSSPFTFRSILIHIVIFIGIAAFAAYVLFQARYFITGPEIELTSKLEQVQTQRLVVLQGRAKNIVYITLNGRQIYTDENGYFKETLILENGYTVATLRAQDRYGRQTTQTKEFVYVVPKTSVLN